MMDMVILEVMAIDDNGNDDDENVPPVWEISGKSAIVAVHLSLSFGKINIHIRFIY